MSDNLENLEQAGTDNLNEILYNGVKNKNKKYVIEALEGGASEFDKIEKCGESVYDLLIKNPELDAWFMDISIIPNSNYDRNIPL